LFFYSLDEDDKGKEVHTLYQKLPLGLLEVEENGKFTNFKVPALSIECKVKSQNNRAANLMRRKILDAKDLFVAQVYFFIFIYFILFYLFYLFWFFFFFFHFKVK